MLLSRLEVLLFSFFRCEQLTFASQDLRDCLLSEKHLKKKMRASQNVREYCRFQRAITRKCNLLLLNPKIICLALLDMKFSMKHGNHQGGVIFIACTGQTVSQAMQKIQSCSLTMSVLSVRYLSHSSLPFSILWSFPVPIWPGFRAHS